MSNAEQDPKGQKPASIATPKFDRGPKAFMNDVSREMKKVNWPTKKETSRLTMIVLSLVAVIVLMLWAGGFAFGTLFELLTKGGKA